MLSPRDSTVLRQTWECKFPVQLILASTDITSPTFLKPVYLFGRRQGYLCSLSEKALHFYRHVLPSLPGQAELEPWFEFQHAPLRWNLPSGVLFDMIAGEDELPWKLTVHYRNCPTSLLTWENNYTPREHFFNSLKEACYICNGSAGSNAVMRMLGPAQDQLWQAVQSGDLDCYEGIVKDLGVTPSVRTGRSHSVPVRLYMRSASSTGVSAPPLASSVWQSTPCTSRAVPAAMPDGSCTQLGDLLHQLLPRQFPDWPQQRCRASQGAQAVSRDADVRPPLVGGAAGGAAGDAAVADSSPALKPTCPAAGPRQGLASEASTIEDPLTGIDGAASQHSTSQSSDRGQHQQQEGPAQAASSQLVEPPAVSTPVLINGISPPLRTPIEWLHANMHAPDLFLYIVIRGDRACA